jgi:hypothetical protein
MNRILYPTTFAFGLLAIAWVGAGYIPGNPLALSLVVLIGAFFLMGALELHHYQQATTSLVRTLDATHSPPLTLGPWLAQLHPSLHHAVRLRVEGERVALPGPALTPYLAGLLVLLGMLGTFLGMVVTLKGTGLALENATDVEAIRASLAAPVRGMALAFGTSVAGVAASAVLGLMSALARRERQRAAQQLDASLAGTLRGFSLAQQREESLRLLKLQTELMVGTLPTLATQLQGLMTQMAQDTRSLHEGLLAGQAHFHDEAQRAYTGLAESVDRSLLGSLAEGARLAGAAIEPAVQATLAGLARQTTALHETLGGSVQRQLEGMRSSLQGSTETLLRGVAAHHETSARQGAEAWRLALTQQQQGQAALTEHLHQALLATVAGFEQHAGALLQSVAQAHADLDSVTVAREQERLTVFHQSLTGLASTARQQALEQSSAMAAHQQQICSTLEQTAQAITAQAEAHARATLGEITQLVQAAAAAPRAAAEVIGELRHALSESLVRDNAVLDERQHLLGTLGGLLDAVNHASTEQRSAIDALVQATTGVLDRVGARFAQSVETESRTLQAVAAQVTGSAAEVASLGEGFGQAVQTFSRASEQLMTQLQRIESALGHSMARSDEQLAYYVAQAREIVDLTLGSQKQIVEDLQQLGKAAATAPGRARAADAA